MSIGFNYCQRLVNNEIWKLIWTEVTACIFSPLFMVLEWSPSHFFYQVIAFALISGIYKSCWKCWYSNHLCFQVTLNVARQCLNLPAKLHLTVFQAGEVIFALHMSMLINHRCHVVTWGFNRDWVKADNILGRKASSFVLLCFSKSGGNLV